MIVARQPIGLGIVGSAEGDVMVWNASTSKWEAKSKADAKIIMSDPASGEYQVKRMKICNDAKTITIHFNDTPEA